MYSSSLLSTLSILEFRAIDYYTIRSFIIVSHKRYINITDLEYKDRSLHACNLTDRKQIYLNGVLDFFKAVGPKQNRLTIYDLPDGVDPFETLDAVDSQIKAFHFSACGDETLFQYLSQYNQSKYIEELTFEYTRIDTICLFFKNMVNLTILNIDFRRDDSPSVNLVDFLNVCLPTLKNLTVRCEHLIIEPLNTRLYSIKKLDISYCTLNSDLGDIISSCFPDLVELYITGEVKENLDINLKSPHLQKASFFVSGIVINGDLYHGFSLKSPNQMKTEYYLCSMRATTPVQHDEIEHLPTLSVVSLTGKKLYLDRGIRVLSC
ncbi:hypothetical protein K501DRAFT_275703 [Backusella circina FSU 941]|nr:hypothetical protein K501DRAFT_275703 [Backusella circina FSU 941]